MNAFKLLTQVVLSIYLSYYFWDFVGLNAWIKYLRKGDLYIWYQSIFVFFLAIFFFLLLFIKRNEHKVVFILISGLVLGYLSSFFAICFWPLLAPNGLERFLFMRWDLTLLPVDALVSGGFLNGFIVSCIFLLFRWLGDFCTRRFNARIRGLRSGVEF